MDRFGITFIDDAIEEKRHTYDDWGLILTNHIIPKPSVRENKVSIPYYHGTVDMTDAMGEPIYNDREGLQFEFAVLDGGRTNCEHLASEIAKFIHGKKLRMITDADTEYFYVVRLNVSSIKSTVSTSKVTLSGTAEPFKYLNFNGSDWLWDTFSFVDGVIIKHSNIVIDGSEAIPLTNSEFYTVPEFVVRPNSNISAYWDGKEYEMITNPDETKHYYFPQIRVKGTDKSISLEGEGTLDINFRGRFL